MSYSASESDSFLAATGNFRNLAGNSWLGVTNFDAELKSIRLGKHQPGHVHEAEAQRWALLGECRLMFGVIQQCSATTVHQ